MEYLIRFVQMHETFRRPEIQALATLANIDVVFLVYSEYVCLFTIKNFKRCFFYDFHLSLRGNKEFEISDIVTVTILRSPTRRRNRCKKSRISKHSE